MFSVKKSGISWGINKAAAVLIISFFFSGCLIFHKVSYEIQLEGPKSGTVSIEITDIRSDAQTEEEFDEDKERLFGYMMESEDFISIMKSEGKNIKSRELILREDTLIGRAVYNFENVDKIEGIVFEEGFYHLTLPLEDSILTTNGEIIKSKNYKRIIWDQSHKVLKFEMLSFSFDNGKYKGMAPFYKPNE